MSRLGKVKRVGQELREVIDKFVADNPHTLKLDEQFGKEDASGTSEEDLEKLRRALADKLLADDWDKHHPLCSWRPSLVEAHIRASGDPEQELVGWLKHGAPTGVAMEIKPSGIFPAVDDTGRATHELDQYWAKTVPRDNYKSFREAKHLAAVEIDRAHKLSLIHI